MRENERGEEQSERGQITAQWQSEKDAPAADDQKRLRETEQQVRHRLPDDRLARVDWRGEQRLPRTALAFPHNRERSEHEHRDHHHHAGQARRDDPIVPALRIVETFDAHFGRRCRISFGRVPPVMIFKSG
jgi:hypothetical protein